MADSKDVSTTLQHMADALGQMLQQRNVKDPLMIGIHTGGVWVAKRLHQLLDIEQELGTLDISFYRDDFTRIGINPQVKPSKLPLSLDDRTIILVDVVLYTGRTIRAAMNELFDYGRPAGVILAVLIDRGGRELPIAADVSGQTVSLAADEHIKLNGPDDLSLTTQETVPD